MLTLVASVFSVSALLSGKQLPLPFTLVIILSAQHHLFHIPFFFHTLLCPSFPSFLFLLNLSTAINTVRANIAINSDTFLLFFHIMESAELKARYPTLPVDVKESILWFCSCRNVPCSEVVRVMTDKAARRKQSLKKSTFLGSGEAMLSEMDTKQVWQVLPASLDARLYANMDVQTAEYIITRFCDRSVAVPGCVVSGICDRINRCGAGIQCRKSRF